MDADLLPQGSKTAQGLKVYYSPSDATVDIIAVPGFAVEPEKSWTWFEKAQAPHKDGINYNWLNDGEGLRKDFSRARIMLYQYNSQYKGANNVDSPLDTIASELLSALQASRKALAHTYNLRERYPGMYECFAGCIFFGVPFEGADLASVASIYASTVSLFGEKWYTSLLHFMEPSSWALAQLRDDLRRLENLLSPRINFYCIFEKEKTDFGKFAKIPWLSSIVNKVAKKVELQFFVSQKSSTLDGVEKHGLHRSHCDLVRFQSANDDGYRNVLQPKLEEYIQVATTQVQKRLNSAEPSGRTYYEVPAAAVSSFSGREGVLQQIKEAFDHLTDPTKSRPPVVVLRAMGGQGKTQIDLEYCRRSRSRYHGVFWIDATSEITVQRRFETLAQKLDPSAAAVLDDPGEKVRLVLDTFAKWEQVWLLVFDNYDQPNRFIIRPYLPTCMPVSRKTWDAVQC
ncbi:hypothetical protein LTR66_010241 [Elasticomyces elasticus]|nr:hypothetical protein LTR66_010241 [Elasticomyces elasticus]